MSEKRPCGSAERVGFQKNLSLEESPVCARARVRVLGWLFCSVWSQGTAVSVFVTGSKAQGLGLSLAVDRTWALQFGRATLRPAPPHTHSA